MENATEATASEVAQPGCPLVTVVVNNYNYARFLGEAIESALAQTYSPLEVIVVDDGSTDESRGVIARYADRITAVLKENGGQASAFNAGFAAARGDIVIFLDADDVMLPTAVARAVDLFAPGVVKVHWPLWEIDGRGQRKDIIHPDKALGEGNLLERTIAEGPLAGNSPPTSGNAWSRALFERILPIPEEAFRINSDGYLHTLAWVYGEVRAVPDPLGLYRVHGANYYASRTPQQRMERHLEKFIHQCKALEAHLRAGGVNPRPGVWKVRKGIYDAEVVAAAKEELAARIPADTPFILVDENAWADPARPGDVAGRRPIPFLERGGEYWGRPPDDATAIREFERLRAEGAHFIVFTWFTWWWLDYYSAFKHHIWDTCSLVVWNDFLAIYDLRWGERAAELKKEIAAVVPLGGRFILVDDGSLADNSGNATEVVPGRHASHFFIRDGAYLGNPADDATAIAELQRLRANGAQFIVFPWFTFWWLDYYARFAKYLRETFPSAVANDRLIVFDLRA